MDNEKWYALYTRPRAEKQTTVELNQRGITNYLPVQKVLRQWSDRRKWVHVPLFTSYIFVKINLKEQFKVLNTPGIVFFIHFNNEIPSIPDWQIENLKIILGSTEGYEIIPHDFKLGEKVNITGGPFRGLKGTLIEHRGKQRVLVSIDTIDQNLAIDVNPIFIERITKLVEA